MSITPTFYSFTAAARCVDWGVSNVWSKTRWLDAEESSLINHKLALENKVFHKQEQTPEDIVAFWWRR